MLGLHCRCVCAGQRGRGSCPLTPAVAAAETTKPGLAAKDLFVLRGPRQGGGQGALQDAVEQWRVREAFMLLCIILAAGVCQVKCVCFY